MTDTVKYIVSFPVKVLLRRGLRKLKRRLLRRYYRDRYLQEDLRETTPSVSLQSVLAGGALATPPSEIDQHLKDYYLSHRFDLLGSGWVKNTYSTPACGLESHQYEQNLVMGELDEEGDWLRAVIPPTHVNRARLYWKKARQYLPAYEPIDWQKDFISGFRWSAQQDHAVQAQLSAGYPGVDIKVPWELSRLQHLPRLAFFAQQEPVQAPRLIKEFMCQSLDFFATNPVGCGVNFNCAMDVGLRAVNLLVAWDLFRQVDRQAMIDQAFNDILAKEMLLYGRFILDHLEHKEGLANNHYLANICGLLFIASYLENSKEVNQWLAFATQELLEILQQQFFADGTNFEGSTAYHLLSTEMLLYSTALLLGLSSDKLSALKQYSAQYSFYGRRLRPLQRQAFSLSDTLQLPEDYQQRLARAVFFVKAITKPNGHIPLFGDADSGHLFRLTPDGTLLSHQRAIEKYLNLQNYSQHYAGSEYWDENHLSSEGFLAAADALFFATSDKKDRWEFQLITALSGGRKLIFQAPLATDSIEKNNLFSDLKYQKEHRVPLRSAYQGNTKLFLFPDFQLYLLRSDDLYLAIAGISNPAMHHQWGHVHNDMLSIELMIDGKELLRDPGTYVYTPLPEERNRYRSVYAHNAPSTERGEPNPWPNLFTMFKHSQVEVLRANKQEIILSLRYQGVQQVRRVLVEKSEILITDQSNVPFTVNFAVHLPLANGYGKLLNPVYEE